MGHGQARHRPLNEAVAGSPDDGRRPPVCDRATVPRLPAWIPSSSCWSRARPSSTSRGTSSSRPPATRSGPPQSGWRTAAAVICPLALAIWLATGRPAISTETLGLSVASGLLEALYFAFLASAYRRGDLSLVYPLARGSAPLLAVAIGVLVLGERLGPIGYAGVAALLIGLLTLQRPWRYLRASGRASGGAAGFALLTGVTIASYSAVDRSACAGPRHGSTPG